MTKNFYFGGVQWALYNPQKSTESAPDKQDRKHGYWVEPFEEGFIISIYAEGMLRGHCSLDFFISMCRNIIKSCPVCQLQGEFEWKDCSEFEEILCDQHQKIGAIT